MLRPFLLWALGSVIGLSVGLFGLIGESSAAKDPFMRVLVKEAKQLRIRTDGKEPLLLRSTGFRFRRLFGLKVREQFGTMHIFLDGRPGERISMPKTSELIISSQDPRGVWLGKRRYRGELRVELGDDGLQVVNHVGLESYVASVVGSEVPKVWPMPVLKAQAIAARTYALQQRRKKRNYDIKATEASQVYLGVESETPTTTEAVKKTRSLVMTYRGKLINAVFHSSSGGMTESSGYVWKKQLPYLIGVADSDQHGSKYQWDMRFTQKQLKVAFREVGGVNNVKLLKLSPSGRILSARIYGPSGDLVVSGKELRKRLGLKSTLVRFKMISSTPFSATLPKTFFYPAKASLIKEFPTKSMRTSRGFWRDWSMGGESTYGQGLPIFSPPPPFDPRLPPRTIPISKTTITPPPPLPPKIRTPEILARGFGAGHGVGMSQWGAHGMALKGANFRKILTHYYNGVAIRPYR